MFKCNFCQRECKNKNSLTNHQIRCRSNPDRKVFPKSSSVFKPGRVSWSKGLTKDTNNTLKKWSEERKGKTKPGHTQSFSTKQKLSVIARERGLGGYQKGSGRGKSGWYKGYYCDSSYELAWIIYNIDHNISFSRNTKKFPYVYKDQQKYWIPDFIDSEGQYIEIKGYMNDQVFAKLKDFPHKILVLQKKDLKIIFEYVINNYGRNFIDLYEKR